MMTDIIKGESREDYMARNNVYLSKWAWECRERAALAEAEEKARQDDLEWLANHEV